MLFVKRGERVDAEARALTAAVHPGVVELVDVVDGALRTVRVDGRSLADMTPLTPDEVAGVAAAVAATLADLHGRGVVHGGVEASHVLVGADGRIVLCSLGRDGDPAGDVAALGRLIAALLAAAPPTASGRAGRRDGPPGRRRGAVETAAGSGRDGRRRRRWDRSGRRERRPTRLGSLLAPPAAPELAALAARAADADPSRRPTARQVADAVHRRIPTARLPAVPAGGPVLALPPAAPGRARWALAGGLRRAILASAVVTPLAAGTVLLRPGSQDARSAVPENAAPAVTTPTAAPAAEPAGSAGPTGEAAAERARGAAGGEAVARRVWPRPAVAVVGGVVTVDGVRYTVGDPGDTVAAGDWACTGEQTLALLRAASGEVFVFDEWARPGVDVTARPFAVVPGATALRAADTDGDGCDDLWAERRGLPPTPVPVRP